MRDDARGDDYATGDPRDSTLDEVTAAVETWQERHEEYGLYTDVEQNRWGEVTVTFRDVDTDQLVREVTGLAEFEEYARALEVAFLAEPLPLAA